MPPERNGFRVSWVLVIAFLLGLMGTGYAMLDARKADRGVVEEMAKDIREIRVFLLGQGQRATP